jgi:hypothetical protein
MLSDSSSTAVCGGIMMRNSSCGTTVSHDPLMRIFDGLALMTWDRRVVTARSS